ncbi:MAG: tetratricopeptide repeat protein [Pseudomonadota bacterium]
MLSQSEITRLLDVANAACHHGHVFQARIILAGILSAKPDHVPAMLGLVYSHIVTDDFVTAESMLSEQILRHVPDDVDAKAMLGFVYSMTKRPEEARATLLPLTQIDDGTVNEKVAAMAKEILATL